MATVRRDVVLPGEKRHRGRPKGSKNKPKPAATRVAAATGWAPETERAYALCLRIIECEDELKRLHAELRRLLVPTSPPVLTGLCSCGLSVGPGPHPVTCSWWRSGPTAGF